MSKNYIDFELVEHLSAGDSMVSLSNKIHKLSEETGELSQAFLRMDNSPNVSASADAHDPKLGVLEECCDVMNVTMDIINALDCTDEEVQQLFGRKLSKWAAKQDKRKSLR